LGFERFHGSFSSKFTDWMRWRCGLKALTLALSRGDKISSSLLSREKGWG
jgi:hypothetical protein